MTTLLDETRINEADVQALKESMTTKELAVSTPVQNDKFALTPVQLLRIAVEQNADVDKLEKLMGLQERWEANEARKAYEKAMNAFKAAPPVIEKNKHVQFGSGDRQVSYDHATLDHVCEQITAGLSRHGISHRWKIKQAEGLITVTCILTHELGHSEETELSGTPDSSGTKNSVQAIGSTVTYLERYSLLAAAGLAAKNSDYDGGRMKMGNLAEKLEFIANCNNEEELRNVFAAAYKEARVAQDATAQKALIAAKDKRKKELA